MHQPTLRPKPRAEKYELVRDYSQELNGISVTVPRGFVYDGATIPPVFWITAYTPFNPMVMGPALIHDWIYYNHQVDRRTADKMLRDLLAINGVSEAKRMGMYQAVRLAGEYYWENDPEDIAYMVRLCRRVQKRPLFDRYRFPQEIILAATAGTASTPV